MRYACLAEGAFRSIFPKNLFARALAPNVWEYSLFVTGDSSAESIDILKRLKGADEYLSNAGET